MAIPKRNHLVENPPKSQMAMWLLKTAAVVAAEKHDSTNLIQPPRPHMALNSESSSLFHKPHRNKNKKNKEIAQVTNVTKEQCSTPS